MPSASDVGGLRGLGPVVVEADEPVFHSDWERRTFGIAQTAFANVCSVDEFRHAMERIPPVAYMSASYYARWMLAAERILVEQGVLTDEEIDARTRELALHPDTPVPRREDPELADAMLDVVYAGVSPRREIDAPRRFDVGDRVVARGSGTDGHTRLPAYVRDRTGVVVRCLDAFVFPDSNARREGEDPHWCYTVRFEAGEVWGPAAEPSAPVFVDLWEPYLEPAP